MATQGGYGLEVKINTGSLTAIAKMVDGDMPAQLKELAEVTAHDSTSGYREFIDTGIRELGEFQVTLLWDDTEATHAQILTSFNATAAVSMSVLDPAGQETIAFSAFIRQISRISKMADGYKANVMIRPTGAPTIT
jgi:deoxyribodipyrimidine photolyase-like uncharacterized protein